MKSVFGTLATIALFTSSALAQSITINTPSNVVVCQPILLSWSGGTAPYFLSVLPGNQPTAAALEDLGTQNGNSFTWLVNIAAGTSIGLNLRDSSGLVAQSAPFTINPGTDSSCVGQNPSSSGSSGGSATTSAAGTTSGAAGTTTGASTTAPAATTPTPTTHATTPATTPTTPASSGASTKPATSGTSAAAASTTSKSAASAQAVQFGAAGLVSAAMIALLA